MSSIASPLTVPVASSRTAAYLQILSRALIAAIFLMSAIGKLTNFGPTVAFSGQMGLPAPQLAIAAAIVLELGGGLALLLGYRVRLATRIDYAQQMFGAFRAPWLYERRTDIIQETARQRSHLTTRKMKLRVNDDGNQSGVITHAAILKIRCASNWSRSST